MKLEPAEVFNTIEPAENRSKVQAYLGLLGLLHGRQ